jgi:hypothetical protein
MSPGHVGDRASVEAVRGGSGIRCFPKMGHAMVLSAGAMGLPMLFVISNGMVFLQG